MFVSGRGSNLEAILDSAKLKNLISVVAVISDKIDCKAFEVAKQHNIKTYVIGNEENELSYIRISELLNELGVELIVLAGYLKLIPTEFVAKFENRIINIHPALLPSFGGKGMYGMNVHRAVFNSGAKVSGATIHFVDPIYDNGKIIDQRTVDISRLTSPEEIAERVLEVEHKLLPDTLEAFAENKIQILDNRVIKLK